MRKFFIVTLLLGATLFVNAQSGTNSPYSQYGLGVLSDQTSGFNRGMNGVGLAFHEHNQVNYLNPASYSALDSITFLFDAGVSLQVTNFEENGVRKNANNTDFEYAVAAFRLLRHVGVSFGIIPFTNVGYNYSSSDKRTFESGNGTSFANTTTYDGEGGFHQVYFGAGWEPVKGLSLGANISYLWGKYSKYVSYTNTMSAANTLIRTYSTQMNSYKLDLGVQYTAKLSKKDQLTVGATYSPGHDLGAEADMNIISSNTTVSTADTTNFNANAKYALPDMYGVGLMWNHNNQLKIGFDYTMQKWGSVDYPATYTSTTPDENGKYQIVNLNTAYMNRQKYNVGLQYCYGERHRSFFKRVQYRLGASYATPYYKMNGVDGPKEISVSAGFGIPIINSYNNRSYLNISGQWVRSTAKDLIKENSFRINIGFTFNEAWFNKWRVQ